MCLKEYKLGFILGRLLRFLAEVVTRGVDAIKIASDLLGRPYLQFTQTQTGLPFVRDIKKKYW